jgi:hypothetical protein
MGNETTVDLPTARALVRLRFAFEQASLLARDLSEPGAHVAIVALDGVVENALYLAARAAGVRSDEKTTQGELYRKVHAALNSTKGTRWAPAGASSIDQLHRARNDAQHAAVQFDREQLPEWAVAVDAFVDGLIEATFGRPLRDVVLADAVRDPGLADMLRRAEHDMDSPEPDAGAFLLICAAFDEARRRWREQQVPAHGQMTTDVSMLATRPAFGMLDPVIALNDRLADSLEVAPFAGDLGAYTSFLAARRQQQDGWTPEPHDSRQALVFVSGWIVRWEVFALGYPLERWEEHFGSLAPPVTGDGEQTKIIGAEAFLSSEFPGHPARCHLVFSLANIPDRARGLWGNWILQALADAANELIENVRFDRVQLSRTGQLLLVCDLGYEADVVARVVDRAIQLTDERYKAWQDDVELRRHELRRLKDAFTEAVFSARRGTDFFDTVDVTERAADGKPQVSLGFNFGDSKYEELGLCVQGFNGAGGVLARAGQIQDQVVFEAFELTDSNNALLRRTIQLCEETVLARRAHYGRRVLEFQRFQNRLSELFS